MRKTIINKYISRVEGESGFYIEIKDQRITKIELRVFEAPRFFEAFLIGRHFSEIGDFTSRICGICPIAYLMSSLHAIEKILGIEVSYHTKQLRRLLYASEWLSSHALHVYMLQGPDFYNLTDCWSNKDYLELAKRGLRLKRLGNKIAELIGGRSIHPINVKVGGFFKFPEKRLLEPLIQELQAVYDESLDAIKWASKLDFKENHLPDIEYISLREESYPMNGGYVCSNKRLNLTMESFFNYIEEFQLSYSSALFVGIKENNSIKPYLTGPIARLNLNFDKLPEEIKEVIDQSGIEIPIKNTHMGIIARVTEIAYAIYEALEIIKNLENTECSCPEIPSPQPGEAVWITEAPRGMLIHYYRIDEKGYVQGCKIIPPTSQNLYQMERNIYQFIEANIGKPADYLRKQSDKIIRNYDPCISCATHLVYI